MFDSEDNWSPSASNPYTCEDLCGDFTGFTVQYNLVNCGPDCETGIAVGTPNNLVVRNLVIDNSLSPTNVADRLTIDYINDSTSVINIRTTYACWYNASPPSGTKPVSGTYNPSCMPFPGSDCEDAGYVNPNALVSLPAVTLGTSQATLEAELVTFYPGTAALSCSTSKPTDACCMVTSPPSVAQSLPTFTIFSVTLTPVTQTTSGPQCYGSFTPNDSFEVFVRWTYTYTQQSSTMSQYGLTGTTFTVAPPQSP